MAWGSAVSMDVERFTQSQYFCMDTMHVKIKILLVDDDSTVLVIVSTLLKMLKYDVTAVKSSMDALSALQVKRDVFDLVVADYHMPGMNGLELQKRVQAEYKLPVIIMSADERECIIMKSLECGAAFFISKPIKPEDVKNIWQYAVAARKGKAVMNVDKAGVIVGGCELTAREVEAMETAREGETMEMDRVGEAMEPEEVDSVASVTVNEERQNRRSSSKRKQRKKDKVVSGESSQSTNPRKSKVVWTTTLHNLFLQALHQIGLDKAVPKKILEYMGVPGLTRENVASHLQKYRIFLRRVADKTPGKMKNLDRPRKSSFVSAYQSLITNDLQQDYSKYPKLSQSSLPPEFGKSLSSSSSVFFGSSSNSLNAIPFPSQTSDRTNTSIAYQGNSSGLQIMSHQVNSTEGSLPLGQRMPFGNAATMTLNSIANTNRTYLEQVRSNGWPLVQPGGAGIIGSTNQGVQNKITGPLLRDNLFLDKSSTGKIALESINIIDDDDDDDDMMNNAGSFMDILTQGDSSFGLNGLDHSTQVFPTPLDNDLAAAVPVPISASNEANKENSIVQPENAAKIQNISMQLHAGESDLFDLVFENIHYSHHRRNDSSEGIMNMLRYHEVPFSGAPNQNQQPGNEEQRVANPVKPSDLQNQATQNQAQQPAVQDNLTMPRPKQQDILTNHASVEDQFWAEDFIDSLLAAGTSYLL